MPRLHVRGAAGLLALGVVCGLSMGSVFADAVLADNGSGPAPSPLPVSVTIPDIGTNGSSPTPTPTATSISTPTPSNPTTSPPRGGGGSGSGGGETSVPHQPGTEPSVPQQPASGTLKVTISPRQVFRSSDRMTVSASGFNPGEKVQLVLYYKKGKPIKIGNFIADSSGLLTKTFPVPNLDAGTDTVQVSGWDSSTIGTATFLMGANWVVPNPSSVHATWLWIGGFAGLTAFAVLAWFGAAALRRAPTVGTEA